MSCSLASLARASAVTGVDLTTHGSIRTRALRPRHPVKKGDVIFAAPPSHVIHPEDEEGRRQLREGGIATGYSSKSLCRCQALCRLSR